MLSPSLSHRIHSADTFLLAPMPYRLQSTSSATGRRYLGNAAQSACHYLALGIAYLTYTAVAAAVLLLGGLSSQANADYTVYTLPGTPLKVLLEGTVKIHPGGNATHRHPRGSLHFNARDIQIIKSPTPQAIFAKRLRDVQQSQDVEQAIKLAQWALRNGMLADSKKTLGAAWKMDSSHPRLRKIAGLMRYLGSPAKSDPAIEAHARDYVGGKEMIATRSKHFLLLHNPDDQKDPVTRQTRAEMRLNLLETVYESYFLTFAFRGVFLRPPPHRLEVVLFSQHGDFLAMQRRVGYSLGQMAGFYLPKENISMFYDAGTSEHFRVLMELDRRLVSLREQAKRTGAANAGELIRFAKTIELLIDIERESEDVSTVSHEAIHHLAANTGLFPRDAAFVRWAHEGLASYFESAKLASWSGAGTVDQNRIGYYRVLEGDRDRGSLEFIVSDLGFLVETALGNQLPAYGQAWALTHFLFNERFDDLMKFYKALGELPPNEEKLTPEILKNRSNQLLELFDASFGDRATLETEWRRYMRSLKTDLEQLAEELP